MPISSSSVASSTTCGSIFASSAQRLITMCHGFNASRNSAVSAKPLPPMRRATSHMSGSVSSPISSIGKRSVNLLSPKSLTNGMSRYEYSVDICE